ncbi:RNA-binding protein [Streptomyces sp. AP-93]|uniref:RNA recognition motif domain-containing protein n=1 Tax=Streptomyces sp. AP-93 TaxID=2929048 RepID=UPI001FB02FCF|nr:RNA-binding protein [Streptomyces sp. AP-93]MCJ0875274.1 RNA-binding protein [Streptomyces sp. AP-93]
MYGLQVSNLHWEADWRMLKVHFGTVGEVKSANVVMDEHGRSKGFGFVVMGSVEEAKKAVETLNGSKLFDRPIVVAYDLEGPGESSRPFSPAS